MKRLVAKVGEYQKNGETKGDYVRVGVLMPSNDDGEYLLLDPSVNLAGVLAKQNIYAVNNGKQARDSVMVSVFSDNNQQQSAPQMNQQVPQMQQGAPQQQMQQQAPQGQQYDQTIPF